MNSHPPGGGPYGAHASDPHHVPPQFNQTTKQVQALMAVQDPTTGQTQYRPVTIEVPDSAAVVPYGAPTMPPHHQVEESHQRFSNPPNGPFNPGNLGPHVNRQPVLPHGRMVRLTNPDPPTSGSTATAKRGMPENTGPPSKRPAGPGVWNESSRLPPGFSAGPGSARPSDSTVAEKDVFRIRLVMAEQMRNVLQTSKAQGVPFSVDAHGFMLSR